MGGGGAGRGGGGCVGALKGTRRVRAREKGRGNAFSRFAFCIITVNWCNVSYRARDVAEPNLRSIMSTCLAMRDSCDNGCRDR